MKKVSLLISLVTLLGLFSCGEDILDVKEAIKNETLTPETLPLIGSWQLETLVLGNGVDLTNECFMEEFVTFNIDGTYLDRRYLVNQETEVCEMVNVFVRGFNSNGDIFETPDSDLIVASYEVVEKNNLILSFEIPVQVTASYRRIKK